MVVSMFLMILGGISFESHFDLTQGKIKKFFNNPEIKFFLGILSISLLLVFINLFFLNKENFFDGFSLKCFPYERFNANVKTITKKEITPIICRGNVEKRCSSQQNILKPVV